MKSALAQQIQLRRDAKETLRIEQKEFGAKVEAEAKSFEEEQKKKRAEQFEKQKAHQRDVRKQIESRSQLLKQIGS